MTTTPDAVAQFLALLGNEDREGFLGFAEATPSVIEIWMYANMLGYDGQFTEMVEWVNLRFRKTDRRKILVQEIEKLEHDIAVLRESVKMDQLKPADAAQKIAMLSKELRGHIIEVDKITKNTDRKGLILSGADRVMRSLKDIFRGNEVMEEALDKAHAAVWHSIAEER